MDNGRPSDFHGAEWSKLINQAFVEPYHTHQRFRDATTDGASGLLIIGFVKIQTYREEPRLLCRIDTAAESV